MVLVIPHGMHALRRAASTALAITEVSLWKNECIYPNCKFPTADGIFARKLIRNVNLTDPMLKSRGSNHTTFKNYYHPSFLIKLIHSLLKWMILAREEILYATPNSSPR